MKIPNCKTSKGFTLIELLVSMIITTIIVLVLVTVTVTSLDIWNRNRSEVRASLQAKAMVDSMAADFESMVVRRGNDFEWLFAEFSPPTDGPNSNQSPSALNLIFFSAATDRYDGQVGDPDKDLGGDISTVGYKLVYKDPISELTNDKYKTFVLYRKLVNPKHTFNHLLGIEHDPAQTALKTALDNLPPDPDEANPDQDIDANKNFVCENVYQFTVKFHIDVTATDAGGITTTKHLSLSLDDTQKFVVTGNGITTDATLPAIAGIPDVAAAVSSGRLTAVEVSLSVITDGALRQLRGRNFSDEEKLSDFIAENSYQYSKLIPVPSY